MNVGSSLKYSGNAVELVDLDTGKTDLQENNYGVCTPSLPILVVFESCNLTPLTTFLFISFCAREQSLRDRSLHREQPSKKSLEMPSNQKQRY